MIRRVLLKKLNIQLIKRILKKCSQIEKVFIALLYQITSYFTIIGKAIKLYQLIPFVLTKLQTMKANNNSYQDQDQELLDLLMFIMILETMKYLRLYQEPKMGLFFMQFLHIHRTARKLLKLLNAQLNCLIQEQSLILKLQASVKVKILSLQLLIAAYINSLAMELLEIISNNIK